MKYLKILALSLLVLNCYAHDDQDQQNDHSHSKPDQNMHVFFQMLNMTRMDEVRLTPVESIEASEVIVRGKIVSITAGRDIVHKNRFTRPITAALVKLKVSEVLKGDVKDFVYFEYIVGGMPIEYLNDKKYPDDILVLLKKPDWDMDSYNFVGSYQGLMHEVDTLYKLTSQRSLLIENHAEDITKIQQPLEVGDPLFVGQSFDHLKEEISALSSGGSYGFELKSASPKTEK